MQPGISLSVEMPSAPPSLAAASPTSSDGNASATGPTFGNELAKLLVVAAQPAQSSTPPATEISAAVATQAQQKAVSPAPATAEPGSSVATSPASQKAAAVSATAQPGVLVATAASTQEESAASTSAPPEAAAASTPEAPTTPTSSPSIIAIDSASPLPVTATPVALHEPATSEGSASDTTTVRRATTRNASSASRSEKSPATAAGPFSAAIAVAPDSMSEVPKTPQPHVEARDASRAAKSAATAQVAAKTADETAAPVTPPTSSASSPQDLQAAVPAQSFDPSPVADIALPAGPTPTHAALQTAASTNPETADSAGSRQSASPVTQIAPALVQIGHAPDGAQRLTMQLEPPDLGHVQVRIDRPTDAPARVEITVDKPETLTLLLRDQPQLQHALDQAGVPAEGRSVTFHVAQTEPSARSEPSTAPAPGVAAGGSSGDGSHNTARNGGRPEQQSGNAEGDAAATPFAFPTWVRGGLDITA